MRENEGNEENSMKKIFWKKFVVKSGWIEGPDK